MNKEEVFLNIISKTLTDSSFLGDDCARLKEYNLVVSADTLVEDVHFKMDTISARGLGKKALLVNISDILASGAKPEYLTVSLSGNLNEEFVKDFYNGADEVCKKYGLKIIGGDLTGGDKISVSITIFGNTKERNISSRSSAKEEYIVLLAGVHGASAKGISILNKTNDTLLRRQLLQKTSAKERLPYKEDVRDTEYFIKTHLEPTLYPKISEAIALNCKEPYAMMDTSDGLFDAFKKISEASGVGFNIDFAQILNANKIFSDGKIIDNFNTVLFGGEDYGLLICISKKDFEKCNGVLSTKDVVKIGTVTKEKKILINGKEVSLDLRFKHFEK